MRGLTNVEPAPVRLELAPPPDQAWVAAEPDEPVEAVVPPSLSHPASADRAVATAKHTIHFMGIPPVTHGINRAGPTEREGLVNVGLRRKPRMKAEGGRMKESRRMRCRGLHPS